MSEESSEDKRKDIQEALLNLLNSSTVEGSQFVTFYIDEEEYGIDIIKVQEIVGFKKLTSIPNTPDYVKGILNLRGNVIPIIDPRKRFNLQEKEYAKTSVVIILNCKDKIMGMIVDKIGDVLMLEKEKIEDTPDMAVNIDTHFLSKVGKRGDNFILILDTDKLLSDDEIHAVKNGI